MAKTVDPHECLPVNNAKFVKDCTELYMGHRGITKLTRFEDFSNLEVLWLNNNSLTRINNLDANVRLKRLFVYNNRLHTLRGSLPHFRFLEALHASHNELHDLQLALGTLARLRHLQHLDLFGNPLAEESNYRLHVVRAVPSLLVLDRHIITDEERAAAAALPAPGAPPLAATAAATLGATSASSLSATSVSVGAPAGASGAARQRRGNKPRVKRGPNGLVEAPSAVERALMADVARIKAEMEAHQREADRALYLASHDNDLEALPSECPLANALDFVAKTEALPAEALDEWERYHLRQLFQEADADKNGWLSKAEMRAVLDRMREAGRAVVVEVLAPPEEAAAGEDDMDAILGGAAPAAAAAAAAAAASDNGSDDGSDADDAESNADSSASRSPGKGPETAAEQQHERDTLDVYFDALDADGNDRVSWAEFLSGATNGLTDREGNRLPSLMWGAVDPSEAKRRAQGLFEQAATLQRRALTLEDGDARRATMLVEAQRLSHRANRVQTVFEKLTAQLRSPPPPQLKPRSDTLELFSYGEQDDASSESDQDEEEETDKQLVATFGLRGSKLETFKARRKARRPHSISRSTVNI